MIDPRPLSIADYVRVLLSDGFYLFFSEETAKLVYERLQEQGDNWDLTEVTPGRWKINRRNMAPSSIPRYAPMPIEGRDERDALQEIHTRQLQAKSDEIFRLSTELEATKRAFRSVLLHFAGRKGPADPCWCGRDPHSLECMRLADIYRGLQ